MRNQNKLYNAQNNQYQRKFISPNQLKISSPTDPLKNNKSEQYRQSQQVAKNKEVDPQSKIQKNKSQSSNQASSLKSSNTQRGQPQQLKQTRNSSKSRERRDYMNANLSKLNRKKQDKSNNSQRSQPKQQKQPRYIYTFKEQINNKQKVNQEYAVNPSTIRNAKLQESQERTSQVESSEIRSNNSSSIAATSKGKPLEVNLVKYDDRLRRPSKEISKEVNEVKSIPKVIASQPSRNPSILQLPQVFPQVQSSISPSPQPSQKRLPLNEATRMQIQSNNQYQTKFSQQLLTKLRNQRQQFSSRLHQLQSQKQKYQQINSQLIEEKYQIQAQLTMALNNVAQLQQEVDALRDKGFRNNKEVERVNNNNERMFKQLEERYNSLLADYRNKIKANSQLSLTLNDQAIQIESYKNSLRSADEQIKNRTLQADKVKRVYEARMVELKQEHQFQTKQVQIRTTDKNKRESNLEESVKQLERQIQAKNREILARSKEIEYLQLQLRDKDQLAHLYHAKCEQNSHLLEELNQNKELIHKINAQSSQVIQAAAIQSKQKDKRIKELLSNIASLKNKGQMERLSTEAQNQLFNENNQSQNSFQQLIKSQSQQTNKLRAEISDKQQLIHRLSLDNDELKQRVRRLQQQLKLNAKTYAVNLSNVNQMKQATEMMLKKRIAALQGMRNMH